jgi:hypothetical protein
MVESPLLFSVRCASWRGRRQTTLQEELERTEEVWPAAREDQAVARAAGGRTRAPGGGSRPRVWDEQAAEDGGEAQMSRRRCRRPAAWCGGGGGGSGC